MKNYVQWLTVMLLAIIGQSCNLVQETPVEQNKEKSISFAISKGNKYNASVYDCTYVQVHILIEKVKAGVHEQVWDTTFTAKRLKQYPVADKAISKTVIIPVADTRDQLEVRCILTYDSKGSRLEMQHTKIMADSNANLSIVI